MMTNFCAMSCDCRAEFISPRGNYPVCGDHYEFEMDIIAMMENA